MSTKTPMTPESAARIQSHADRTGTNQSFKSRSQQAAAENAPPPPTKGTPAPKD